MSSKNQIDETEEIADASPNVNPNAGSGRKVLATILVVAAVIILVGLIVLAVIYLAGHSAQTTTIRDIFIIFMALESLVIGTALVILIIQVASLLNLVNNEVRPIIEDAQETITTLNKTSNFLSDELVKPVVKISSFLAGARQLLSLFSFRKRK